MKGIEITYIVENENWTDDEYEDKSERIVVIDYDELKYLIKRNVKLDENEFIEDIWRIKEKN